LDNIGSSTGILQSRTLTSKRFVTLHHLLCVLLVGIYYTATFLSTVLFTC